MTDDSSFNSFLQYVNYSFDNLLANVKILLPHCATFDSVTLPTDLILDQVQTAISLSNEKNRELESLEETISKMNFQIEQNERTTDFEEANKEMLKKIQDEYIKQGEIEEKKKNHMNEIEKLNEELLDFQDFIKQTEDYMRKDLNAELEVENGKFEKYASEMSEKIGVWYNTKLEIQESLNNSEKENEMLKLNEKNIVKEEDLKDFESKLILRLKNVVTDLNDGISEVSKMLFEKENNQKKIKKDEINDIILSILQLNSKAVYRKNMFNEEINYETLYNELSRDINSENEEEINDDEYMEESKNEEEEYKFEEEETSYYEIKKELKFEEEEEDKEENINHNLDEDTNENKVHNKEENINHNFDEDTNENKINNKEENINHNLDEDTNENKINDEEENETKD